MKLQPMTFSLVRHAALQDVPARGLVFAVGVHKLEGLSPLEQLAPSAEVLSAHAQAVTTPSESATEQVRAAWRADLRVELVQRHGHLREFTTLGGRFVRTSTSTVTLACGCSDEEEAVGLCPRPLIAEALVRAGHAVLLDGAGVPPRTFSVLRRTVLDAERQLFEERPCGHRHRMFSSAARCADNACKEATSADRRKIGDEVAVVDDATSEVLWLDVKSPPPAFFEETGVTAGGLRWTSRTWRQIQRPRGRPPFLVELQLERNGLDLGLKWPSDPHLQLTRRYLAGFADAISYMLDMQPERLTQLQDSFHTPGEGVAEIVRLPAAEVGPPAPRMRGEPAPAGRLLLMPTRHDASKAADADRSGEAP